MPVPTAQAALRVRRTGWRLVPLVQNQANTGNARVVTSSRATAGLSCRNPKSLPRRGLIQASVEADETDIRWVLLGHSERSR